jgi:hypothetical protein
LVTIAFDTGEQQAGESGARVDVPKSRDKGTLGVLDPLLSNRNKYYSPRSCESQI